jgi:hypothetical protein
LQFILKLLFGDKNVLGVFLEVEQVLSQYFVIGHGFSELAFKLGTTWRKVVLVLKLKFLIFLEVKGLLLDD